MALPGLVAANNLSDVADRERAWDNLGASFQVSNFNVWDAEIDLRTNLLSGNPTNPNGPWRYGFAAAFAQSPVSLSTILTSDGWSSGGAASTPYFRVNLATTGGGISSYGAISFGVNIIGVVRWTAPRDSSITIEAVFEKSSEQPFGNGVNPRIYKNNALLYDGGTMIQPGLTRSAYVAASVITGDTISFEVSNNNNGSFDGFLYKIVRIFYPS